MSFILSDERKTVQSYKMSGKISFNADDPLDYDLDDDQDEILKHEYDCALVLDEEALLSEDPKHGEDWTEAEEWVNEVLPDESAEDILELVSNDNDLDNGVLAKQEVYENVESHEEMEETSLPPTDDTGDSEGEPLDDETSERGKFSTERPPQQQESNDIRVIPQPQQRQKQFQQNNRPNNNRYQNFRGRGGRVHNTFSNRTQPYFSNRNPNFMPRLRLPLHQNFNAGSNQVRPNMRPEFRHAFNNPFPPNFDFQMQNPFNYQGPGAYVQPQNNFLGSVMPCNPILQQQTYNMQNTIPNHYQHVPPVNMIVPTNFCNIPNANFATLVPLANTLGRANPFVQNRPENMIITKTTHNSHQLNQNNFNQVRPRPNEPGHIFGADNLGQPRVPEQRTVLINPHFKGQVPVNNSRLIWDSTPLQAEAPSLYDKLCTNFILKANRNDDLLRQQEQFINENRLNLQKRMSYQSNDRETPERIPSKNRNNYYDRRNNERSRPGNIKSETRTFERPSGSQANDTIMKEAERPESEDEETRAYRLKIEEQKKQRELLLHQKEERRRMRMFPTEVKTDSEVSKPESDIDGGNIPSETPANVSQEIQLNKTTEPVIHKTGVINLKTGVITQNKNGNLISIQKTVRNLKDLPKSVPASVAPTKVSMKVEPLKVVVSNLANAALKSVKSPGGDTVTVNANVGATKNNKINRLKRTAAPISVQGVSSTSAMIETDDTNKINVELTKTPQLNIRRTIHIGNNGSTKEIVPTKSILKMRRVDLPVVNVEKNTDISRVSQSVSKNDSRRVVMLSSNTAKKQTSMAPVSSSVNRGIFSRVIVNRDYDDIEESINPTLGLS